jgi:hypothetical protein
MADVKRRSRWLLVGVTATAMAIGGYFLWEFIRVDKCLDAGGRWENQAKRCDTTPDRSSNR